MQCECIQHVCNLNTHAEIERSLKIITSAYIEAIWPMPSELRLFSYSVGAILFLTTFNDFFTSAMSSRNFYETIFCNKNLTT